MFDFGKRIADLRKTKNISAEKLARAIEISVTQISRIENGRSNPTVKTLDNIIEYFGISYSDFFDDETAYTKVEIGDAELYSPFEEDDILIKDKEGDYERLVYLKITKEEMEMVKAFRQASEAEKAAINVLLEQYKNKSEDLEVKHA